LAEAFPGQWLIMKAGHFAHRLEAVLCDGIEPSKEVELDVLRHLAQVPLGGP
jgi:hypothetical protein